MAGFSESLTVQAWLVERLVALGWEHVPGKELPREFTASLVEEWVIQALAVLNPDLHGDPDRVDEVLPLSGRRCSLPRQKDWCPRTSG